MEDEAKQVLSNLLTRAVEGIDAAVTFSQAQIPDVIEQLLTWHCIRAFVASGLWVILAVALGVAMFRVIKGCIRQDEWVKNPGYSGYYVRPLVCWFFPFGTVFFVLAISGVANNLLDGLQILIAPKLYLLEYAASLVK